MPAASMNPWLTWMEGRQFLKVSWQPFRLFLLCLLGLRLFGLWLVYVLLGQVACFVSCHKSTHCHLLVFNLHFVNGAKFPFAEELDDFLGGEGSNLLPPLGNGVFFFVAHGLSVGIRKRNFKR